MRHRIKKRWIRTRLEDIGGIEDQEDQTDAWHDFLNQLSAKQICLDGEDSLAGAIRRLNNRLNR